MGHRGARRSNALLNHPKASHEEIHYHLYVLEKAKRGLERADPEEVIPHVDAKARLGKWITPYYAIMQA